MDIQDAIYRAYALADARRFDEARQIAQDAVGADPQSTEAWLCLASCCNRCGAIDEALAAIAESHRLSPNNAEVLNLYGWICLEASELNKALLAARQAVGEQPDDAEMHELLAWVHLTRGHRRKAMHAASEAVRLQPQSVLALNAIGLASAEAGEFREAQASYYTSLRIDPANEQTQLLLSALRRQVGDHWHAQELAEQVLREDATSEGAQEMLHDLSFKARARHYGVSKAAASVATETAKGVMTAVACLQYLIFGLVIAALGCFVCNASVWALTIGSTGPPSRFLLSFCVFALLSSAVVAAVIFGQRVFVPDDVDAPPRFGWDAVVTGGAVALSVAALLLAAAHQSRANYLVVLIATVLTVCVIITFVLGKPFNRRTAHRVAWSVLGLAGGLSLLLASVAVLTGEWGDTLLSNTGVYWVLAAFAYAPLVIVLATAWDLVLVRGT